MEDDQTYHNMKVHDNTIQKWISICFTIVSFALMLVQSKSIVITLSVVSINYIVFIFSYRFGLVVLLVVPGPQGAGAAPSLQCGMYSIFTTV